MRKHIEDLVAEFNEVITAYKPGNEFSKELVELRVSQMKEELSEIEDALNSGIEVEAVDGLIDLIYFALGTLHIMGVHREIFNACFTVVHMANMMKEPGIKEERRLKDVPDHLHPLDAIKPLHWISPETIMRAILDGRRSDT